MPVRLPGFALCRLPGHADLLLRVTPNAGRDSVEAVETRADGQVRLKVRVRAVPEDGKANKAVCALLARSLGIAKSDVTLVSGATSRDKTVRVALDDETAKRIAALGS